MQLLSHGRDGDVAELTGTRHRQLQIENLQQNGIEYTVGRDGWPRVWQIAVEPAGRRIDSEPDFTALEGARGGR